jgi:hypothetical protein
VKKSGSTRSDEKKAAAAKLRTRIALRSGIGVNGVRQDEDYSGAGVEVLGCGHELDEHESKAGGETWKADPFLTVQATHERAKVSTRIFCAHSNE